MTIGAETLATLQRHADAPTLNSQELAFAAAILTGVSVAAASRSAGISENTGYEWRKRTHIAEFIRIADEERRMLMAQSIRYSLEDAHLDIEMGKRMAANATEWFRGVELHMRLHGLGQKKEVDINVNNVSRVDQLQQIDDAALLEIAGATHDAIFPEIIDAEYEEVDG